MSEFSLKDLNFELDFFLNKLELIFFLNFNKIYIRVIFCFFVCKKCYIKGYIYILGIILKRKK